jgi:hypothetical protein
LERVDVNEVIEEGVWYLHGMAGLAINPVQGFRTWHLLYWVKFTFETCFRGLLFVIRPPSYLVWSKTFLLVVGLTDLSEFGRYLGQIKAIVRVFNGPVSSFNVGIVLILLATAVVWLDRPQIQFRFFGPSSFNTALNWF